MKRGDFNVQPPATRWLGGAAIFGLWFAALLSTSSISAQYVPETVPRAGEQRLNRFQYHATHNSFERDNGFLDRRTIKDQLDYYNTWMIEFDLRWCDDSDDFYVFHDCFDAAGEDWLDDYFAEVDTAQRSIAGLTFIYFDDGELNCFAYPCIVPKPGNWPTLLKNKCLARWSSRVYTHADFVNIDNEKWPSAQELLRRGKNFVLIINGNNNAISSGNFFFATNFFAEPGAPCVFLKNVGDEDSPITTADLGDRFLARHYPSGGWTCLDGDGDTGWAWSVNNNYTFTASNCADKQTTTSHRFHPPIPTYVAASGSGGGRGGFTSAFSGPSGVIDAVTAVQNHQNAKGASTIPIRINTGTYSAPSRISAAVRLYSGGPVRLQ